MHRPDSVTAHVIQDTAQTAPKPTGPGCHLLMNPPGDFEDVEHLRIAVRTRLVVDFERMTGRQ